MPDDGDDDPFADFPDDVGVDELDDLERAEQTVSIRTETRTYGKTVTIVEGFESGFDDVEDLASTLKSRLGTGGTVDDGRIELQGDHRERVVELLGDEGFAVDGA